MFKTLKKTALFILTFAIISCGAKKTSTKTKLKVNTHFNERYKNSVKTFTGVLNNTDYNALKTALKTALEKELGTTLPNDKAILINYNQEAPNCIGYTYWNIGNRVRISSRISNANNAMDFFVYNANAFHKELYEKYKKYRLDTGFFYNTIFTLHENCKAFFIVKPNGDFLKYYGEDYFSIVEDFLKKD
ncbi:hypothetical protein [Pontimicrobium sp. MEBiC06410]